MPVCIDNNTARPIALFATPSVPRGYTLLPGGMTRVPDAYWAEFIGHEVEMEARGAKKPAKRFPGLEQIEDLKRPAWIVTPGGDRRHGPQITVYEQDQVDREEGPPAPQSLKGLRDEQAEAFVKATTDRTALRRWAEENGPMSALARSKLGA